MEGAVPGTSSSRNRKRKSQAGKAQRHSSQARHGGGGGGGQNGSFGPQQGGGPPFNGGPRGNFVGNQMPPPGMHPHLPPLTGMGVGKREEDDPTDFILDDLDRLSSRDTAVARYKRNHELLSLIFDARRIDSLTPLPSPYASYDQDELRSELNTLRSEIETIKQAHVVKVKQRREEQNVNDALLHAPPKRVRLQQAEQERQRQEEQRAESNDTTIPLWAKKAGQGKVVGVGFIRAETPDEVRSLLPKTAEPPETNVRRSTSAQLDTSSTSHINVAEPNSQSADGTHGAPSSSIKADSKQDLLAQENRSTSAEMTLNPGSSMELDARTGLKEERKNAEAEASGNNGSVEEAESEHEEDGEENDEADEDADADADGDADEDEGDFDHSDGHVDTAAVQESHAAHVENPSQLHEPLATDESMTDAFADDTFATAASDRDQSGARGSADLSEFSAMLDDGMASAADPLPLAAQQAPLIVDAPSDVSRTEAKPLNVAASASTATQGTHADGNIAAAAAAAIAGGSGKDVVLDDDNDKREQSSGDRGEDAASHAPPVVSSNDEKV